MVSFKLKVWREKQCALADFNMLPWVKTRTCLLLKRLSHLSITLTGTQQKFKVKLTSRFCPGLNSNTDGVTRFIQI